MVPDWLNLSMWLLRTNYIVDKVCLSFWMRQMKEYFLIKAIKILFVFGLLFFFELASRGRSEANISVVVAGKPSLCAHLYLNNHRLKFAMSLPPQTPSLCILWRAFQERETSCWIFQAQHSSSPAMLRYNELLVAKVLHQGPGGWCCLGFQIWKLCRIPNRTLLLGLYKIWIANADIYF